MSSFSLSLFVSIPNLRSMSWQLSHSFLLVLVIALLTLFFEECTLTLFILMWQLEDNFLAVPRRL